MGESEEATEEEAAQATQRKEGEVRPEAYGSPRRAGAQESMSLRSDEDALDVLLHPVVSARLSRRSQPPAAAATSSPVEAGHASRESVSLLTSAN